MSGYAGSILVIDLTAGESSSIPTERYREWGGGHGMGSALFWDLCRDKTVSGFDPGNVVTMMTSPLAGTLAPSASRCEVQGIGVQSSPEWFTRSNFGGRFAAMLKSAGWDGIAVTGAAKHPVWVRIVDDRVEIRDAREDDLWGLDTWDTQTAIWNLEVFKETTGWRAVERGKSGRTTAHSAIVTIGPAGERRSRIASLVHDAGNAASQGGFGGVLGAKNLKAISVIGTGSFRVADPVALLNARLEAKENHFADPDAEAMPTWERFARGPAPDVGFPMPEAVGSRPQACRGCIGSCRARFSDRFGNESSEVETSFYGPVTQAQRDADPDHRTERKAADLAQRFGLDVYELDRGLHYLRRLLVAGVLGRGKQVDIDLPWSEYGSDAFVDRFVRMIAAREGAGDAMAEGFWRAAQAWGRLETDSADGTLEYPYWGVPAHDHDPRAESYWGLGSLLGDRDINEQDFSALTFEPRAAWAEIRPSAIGAREAVAIVAGRLEPYIADESALDFSEANAYSEGVAGVTRWHRHYTRFWKQSALYCDYRFADFHTSLEPGHRGYTPVGEPLFWNAVTGDSLTFEQGLELGRRIWNLDNAIWTLQGRHRDAARFAPYIHRVPLKRDPADPYLVPMRTGGAQWAFRDAAGRTVDERAFEGLKTAFYRLEGWDPASGWPTRATLEALNLGPVADALEKAGRLGGAGSAQ